MTCYFPKDAWRIPYPEYGQSTIVFRASEKQKETCELIPIPCRKCMGCRIDYGKQWTVRIMHEAQMAGESVFLTLTYNDEKLPSDGSIRKLTLQNFHKTLRNNLSPVTYRHYSIGEYGDEKGRPHYHSVIFGYEFPDKMRHKYNSDHEDWIYTSETLSKAWGKGFATVQPLQTGRATYIASYITKKLDGPQAVKYKGKQPEFALISNQPGLGFSWFEKYHSDVFPSDFVILDGKRFPVPPYYDKLNAFVSQYDHEETLDWRVYNALMNPKDRTPEALLRRAEYHLLVSNRKTRNLAL